MDVNPNNIPLQKAREFFNNGTSVLTEEDSGFKPKDEMYTVAQHVEHAAITVHWFADAVEGKGFDLDFETFEKNCRAATSLTKAREHFEEAFDHAEEIFGAMDMETVMAPIPDNPIMGPVPRVSLIGSIVEHTAHHRGALSVYARLLDKEPAMPYGEM